MSNTHPNKEQLLKVRRIRPFLATLTRFIEENCDHQSANELIEHINELGATISFHPNPKNIGWHYQEGDFLLVAYYEGHQLPSLGNNPHLPDWVRELPHCKQPE